MLPSMRTVSRIDYDAIAHLRELSEPGASLTRADHLCLLTVRGDKP